jgi:hypothetical protein
MPERMSDRMSEYMPDRMLDRMSEYLCHIYIYTSRLPDDMSATMCQGGLHTKYGNLLVASRIASFQEGRKSQFEHILAAYTSLSLVVGT